MLLVKFKGLGPFLFCVFLIHENPESCVQLSGFTSKNGVAFFWWKNLSPQIFLDCVYKTLAEFFDFLLAETEYVV